MKPENRHLAAIMFSDIVGYSTLMGRDEEKGIALLHKNREIQRPLIEKYYGKWIKEMGDGVLAQFDSAYNATACAIDIQQTARKEFEGSLRIGLHLGEIIVEHEDIFGDGVNIASRIESLADPGGIYLSEAIQKELQNHKDIQTGILGEVSLKNINEPVKIHYVAAENLPIPGAEKIQRLRKETGKEDAKNTTFFKHPAFYLLIAVLVALPFAIKYWYGVKSVRTVKAIAVLPFTNLTGNREEQYFVDMMHDAVIGELARISDLVVKSRTSTMQFRDTNLTIPEIAKMLKVDAVIESSVYKTGNSVLLQVQLIRARPVEDHIWSQEFERDTKDILSLYSELAKTVAGKINVQLTPQEEIRLTHSREVNSEAYKAYLHGRFYLSKLTKKDLEKAKFYFNKAKAIDPGYSLAYVGLAGIEEFRSQMGLVPWHESAPVIIKNLTIAFELDSLAADINNFYGTFNFWGLWKFSEAKKQYEKALELKPNDAGSRVFYAQILCIFGDYKKAMIQGEKAIQIDPYNNFIKGIYGMNLNFCREYKKAENIFNDILDSDPYNSIAISNIKSTYHQQKKYQKAFEIWKIDYLHDSLALSVLEEGYENGGYPIALKNLAELMVERSEQQYVTPWRIGTIYTRAGMKEEALDYLDKAYNVHDPNMPYIITDPIFDFMRDDPRFQVLIRKMNYPVSNI